MKMSICLAVVMMWSGFARAETDASKMLGRVGKSVFQVLTADEGGTVFGAGTGFLVSHEGFAVTNFHVIQGAFSAKARVFTGRGQIDVPVELWAFDPDLDLALLKLPNDGVARASMVPRH